ncbi:MAG: 3'-5' exonuclease [Flavobacteriales bacterium]|nr:3'-5' exonuclease [Flavobacteriales bacterium]
MIARAPQPATPPRLPAYEVAMHGLKFAVIDVETTEGDPLKGRVMEVAVIAMDGGIERMRWESLVHPGQRVPWFSRKLTGINDSMLCDAPRFHEVARTIATLTQDRIVVAHNARFDMTALAHEFARTGLPIERATICTEKLGRRLAPQLEHHNLGSLCRHYGINFPKAHRALADAEATAALLACYLERFGADAIAQAIVPVQRALRA